jgi:hypoxanthine-DNA glycosylase
MSEVIRNRTIRPSSRLESSKSYKVDTRKVCRGDTLIVNIDHESNPFRKTFRFNGSEIAGKASISFRINKLKTSTEVIWSGALPIDLSTDKKKSSKLNRVKSNIQRVNPSATKPISSNLKMSLDAISNVDTRILILGTIPGDKSLLQNEYYANKRNKFWKIIATITNVSLPFTYQDKIELLHSNHIGIWDVVHKANREGSLDAAIKDEYPNDIYGFISKHNNLRVICFNGTKSQSLYDKYFIRETSIKYVLLPSTSSANARMAFDNICKQWKQIFTS